MAEDRNVYKIHDNGSLGEVQIADEVVAIIAGLAATEVEGVASMAGNIDLRKNFFHIHFHIFVKH